MNNKIPDRLTVGQTKSIIKMLQIGLANSHDKRSFILTAINPQDILDIIKREVE